MTWPCKYCGVKFSIIDMSVYHEPHFCDSNHKFKYRKESRKNDTDSYNDYLNKYISDKYDCKEILNQSKS